MKEKPDNIIYNYKNNEYDAFKKSYPTGFNSKNFSPDEIKKFKSETQHYFKSKLFEIKNDYEKLIKEIEWTETIHNSKYKFIPIVGKTYYLYKGKESNFLIIISPKEWKTETLGAYKLNSNNTWTKL